MILKAQGRTIRKPPQFERLNLPLKMNTMVEGLDGVKVEFTAPMSQKF